MNEKCPVFDDKKFKKKPNKRKYNYLKEDMDEKSPVIDKNNLRKKVGKTNNLNIQYI